MAFEKVSEGVLDALLGIVPVKAAERKGVVRVGAFEGEGEIQTDGGSTIKGKGKYTDGPNAKRA